MTRHRPTLRLERSLQRQGYPLLAGMDEVGRGALAGPVSVGVVLVDEVCRTAPRGIQDSKLLTASARAALAPKIRKWASAHGVGHAWPAEIDRLGIIAALRLAGTRALAALPRSPDLVVLDGNHDWLTPPEQDGLLAFADRAGPLTPPVLTMVKADLRCSSVAAASVLAKVARDELMVGLARRHPAYGWSQNKGYAARGHREALVEHGPCVEHRRSWRLPGAVDRELGSPAAVVERGQSDRSDPTGELECAPR